MQKKILVTGTTGQVGSELQELAPLQKHLRFHFLTRHEFSLDKPERIGEIIEKYKPDFLVNCAAYTAVDKAESEKDEAFKVNSEAVGLIAAACATYNVKFLHLSTDYVFDGSTKSPLKEDHPVNPINVYGVTKLGGEQAALKNNPASLIIRTSWVYSSYGKNFVKTMMRLMAEKESINVVGDQWGSPTYAADLAGVILQIVRAENWQPGIYHYANEGTITWADFAKEIASQLKAACQVYSIATADYPTPAKRPLYSVMDKTKIVAAYKVELRPWKESLQECVQKIQRNLRS